MFITYHENIFVVLSGYTICYKDDYLNCISLGLNSIVLSFISSQVRINRDINKTIQVHGNTEGYHIDINSTLI